MYRVRFPSRISRRVLAVAAATGAVAVAGVTAAGVALAAPSTSAGSFTFKLAPAAGITSCLPHAGGKVTITPDISSDKMTISVNGLPGVQHYALFDLQQPTKPFGVATFLTYISVGKDGHGSTTVNGIFDSRTFSMSLGGSATFAPTHEFHLGIWFNNPKTPFKLGCEPGATKPVVTPFNGTHNAGILVLGTAQFPVNAGPLSHVAR
jgi:hypothetical protein